MAAAGRIAAVGLNLALNVLLVRVLPLNKLGLYYLATSLVTFSALVASMGSQQTLPRLFGPYGAVRADEIKSHMETTALLAAFGTAAVLLSIYAFGPTLWTSVGAPSFEARFFFPAIALWLLASVALAYSTDALRAFGRFTLFAIFERPLPLLISVAVLAYLKFAVDHVTLRLVFWVSAISCVLAAAISSTVLANTARRILKRGRGFLLRLEFRQVLKIAAPLWVVTLCFQITSEVHVWIVGAGSSAAQAGLYGLASRVAQLLALPLVAATTVCSPTIARLSAEGNANAIEELLRVLATVVFIMCMIICITIIIAGRPVLAIVFGSDFKAAYPVALILMVGQTISAFLGAPGMYLAMTDGEKTIMANSILSGVAGVLISATLVPSLGAEGGAAGAVVGLGMLNLLNWWHCRKRYKLRTEFSLRIMATIRRKGRQPQ